MAQDNERRKKFWDEEDDDGDKPARTGTAAKSTAGQDSAIIDQKINEARVLMEQVHQLYSHYFTGLEKRTPIEKFKILEGKINELQRLGTNLTTAKFKIGQFLAQYATMKNLWERKLRDMEKK